MILPAAFLVQSCTKNSCGEAPFLDDNLPFGILPVKYQTRKDIQLFPKELGGALKAPFLRRTHEVVIMFFCGGCSRTIHMMRADFFQHSSDSSTCESSTCDP